MKFRISTEHKMVQIDDMHMHVLSAMAIIGCYVLRGDLAKAVNLSLHSTVSRDQTVQDNLLEIISVMHKEIDLDSVGAQWHKLLDSKNGMTDAEKIERFLRDLSNG